MKVVSIPTWVTATNAYLVYESRGDVALLIDVPPDPEFVSSVIIDHGVTVGAVLLTHGHVDHTGGAGEIASSQGSEVFVHPDDDFLTLHPRVQLERIFGFVPPGSYEVPEKLTALEDGQIIEIGGHRLETLHTPGHTPGHCCFHAREEGVLFSGDQLFAGSVGRTDLPGGSWDDLIASMTAKVLTLDDSVKVLPGHGPETTVGRERRSNPFIKDL